MSSLDKDVGEADAVREVFDAAPVILCGLAGPDHRVIAANAAYRATLGRSDFLGTPLAEVFPELAGQQLYEMADRVYRTGVPQVGQGWRAHIERDSGSGQLVELYVDFTMSPRFAADGTVIGLNYFGLDATERVLEQRRARLATAEAVRLYQDAREVINTLQRQLLPDGLPVLPAVQIAGSYLLADAGDAAGGDWFDAVPLPDGRVALAVGDVVGHGVAASAAMGQIRAVLHDRLDETGDPLVAIAAADRVARRVPGARATTVCVVVLDPADGAITYCSAGHPPPLIAGPRESRYLAGGTVGALGTGAAFTLATARLDPGEVLLLYSDGIIERPGRTPATATVELARVAVDAVAGRGLDDSELAPAGRVCLHGIELLVRQTGHSDDITLLAAARRTPAPPLRLSAPAGATAIRPARDALVRWLLDLGAGESDLAALSHAVVELVTNAAEHSHPDTGGGRLTVAADLDTGGIVRVAVGDDGHWHPRDRPGDQDFRRDHGLGLAMAAGLADELRVDHDGPGTTVTIRRRLSTPAALLTTDEISSGAEYRPVTPAEPTVFLDRPAAPSSRLAIHGPLDAINTERLSAELGRLTLGGTQELIVDLTGVTHLASAAVAVLYRSPGLRLYAPAGSVAQHVLTLAALPYTTADPHGSEDPA
ncbi:SpoIIE family protein phosphatase [Actinoplanes sp. HUAS TT8]|uniref:SpoIIE family protein phosphatase n=1 Tax=Actinoplanes sp. HUAS TT8 TaxID=3447453 RepID=UPI003F5241E1